MLQALTVAILLGLVSGRPSFPSGQEINIADSTNLIYVYGEPPNVKDPIISQLEKIPNLQPSIQSLLRNRRDVETTVMNYIERFVIALTNVILVPIEAILSLISNLVVSLVEAIFGLLSGILNPILELLTELLNPILRPLRPLLNPILDPLNKLLSALLKALHLPLALSGLLTGNTTSIIFLPTAVATKFSSPQSSSEQTVLNPVPPAAQIPPIQVSTGLSPKDLAAVQRSTVSSAISEAASPIEALADPVKIPFDTSQGRRRRATSLLPVTDLFAISRDRRQSIDPSLASAIDAIARVPLLIVTNIASAIKNILLFPLKLILTPIFALLHIPVDIISLPFDLIGSIVSTVTSPVRGIIKRIAGPVNSLIVGIIDLVLTLAKGIIEIISGISSIPSTIVSDVLQSVADPSNRRRRDVMAAVPAGPLNVILSILSGPLEILSNFLASLLGNFNISYATLQEAAQVFLSNAVKRFLVMAYTQMKNIILPGVDNILQSIVGSEYIPDYLKSAITQFHTIYRLIRLMGYLRPS